MVQNNITAKILQLEQTISKAQNNLKQLKENTIYCYKCKNYFYPEDAKTTSREETHRRLVCPDCGYGDDDIYADVTDLMVYYICPECGNLLEKTRFFLGMENERRRYD